MQLQEKEEGKRENHMTEVIRKRTKVKIVSLCL